MRINHVIASIDKRAGGPSQSVVQLIAMLSEMNNTIQTITLNTIKSKNRLVQNFEGTKARLNFFDANALGYSKKLKRTILNFDADLFHGHGLWEMPVHIMAKIARKSQVPYIISVRGMLDEWSINHKSLKKQLALKLYQRTDLSKATCLHATSDREAENIRALGFTNPIAIIPNGVLVPKVKSKLKKKTVLFLARLVKNKGIEELLNVWKRLDNSIKSDWILKIVGDGDKNYVKQLKDIAREDKSIFFLGALYDDKKQEVLDETSLFVLPTYSENFGNAIAEALANDVPVITTKGAPWKDLETHNCGWWIDINELALQKTVEKALLLSFHELRQMGDNGKQLIFEKYSIENTAHKMFLLYNWLLKKDDKPDFVKI